MSDKRIIYNNKRWSVILLLVSLAVCLCPSQQALAQTVHRFFNLTADEIRIDSVLPEFTCVFPLGENYQDSVYEVSVKYPEFIDMTPSEIERYHALSQEALPEMPVVTQQYVVERKKGSLEIGFTPMVMRQGRYQFLVSFMLEIKSESKKNKKNAAMSTRAPLLASGAQQYASKSVLAEGNWVKIRVPSNGVYQLTDALVRQAGFSNLSKVRIYGYGGHLQNEKLVTEELAATDDLKEVPTYTIGGKRLFYAKGPVSWSSETATSRTRNPYSDYGYYFLTEDDTEPLSVDSATFVSSFYPSADDYHSLHEIDNYAWYHGGRNLCENTPINAGSSKTYTLANDAHASNGKLSVGVTAGSASSVSISLNGKELGTINFSLGEYDKGAESEKVYNVTDLHNVDSITITTKSGGPVRLDYISMTYDTPRAAPNLLTTSFPTPEYVYAITQQNLHGDGAYDMVIIIPTSQKLLEQAQRLATFHQTNDSLRVRIVPADELYNEFSSGTPDINAYRRYLKMLYDRAETEKDMPKYVLLFGDCVWDNRMLTSDTKLLNPDDYLLVFESENSFSEVYCYMDDGFITLLDEGEGSNPTSADKQDIAVGRFPVATEQDAETMVNKTIAYAQNANAGAWQNTLMFMGDDGNSNLHMRDVNEAAETISELHPGYLIKKVMWDAYKRETSATGNTYPDVTKVIKQQQAEGALIMDYAGHGREDQISHESVLRLTDFQAFNNENLPLWITASCNIMPFDGTFETIGEASVLNKKGGSVAFYGTTRTVYATENKKLNIAFLKHVLSYTNGKPTTMGEAQRLAKNEMITTRQDLSQNKLQYSLLGDPALALNLPTRQVVIDAIAGVDMTRGTQPVLKAGSIVSVKGHIVNNDAKDTSFRGKMTATVRDTRELITCKRNDPELARDYTPAFTFYDYQKVLYNGSDSIRNGEFDFTFAVPRDINYADGNGLLNVYAVNNERTAIAHGSEDNFLINGTETISNDSIGPSIYCYLNSPSFVNGGDVNSTPYFVAEITDKDGINATGNGIGHDLELIIDGDMTKTYNLNNNFTFDFGSYTKGTTFYSIPELENGTHTLKFRAWDILNNSSTATLQFNVVKGLEPNIVDISCTKNPAKTSTTFIVTHNYVGSDVDVEIEVFDTSGRLLWQHEESGVSTNGSYSVDWDLTLDSGGQLQTGVYLYRIRLSSDGSSKASKAKKLVIIR